MNERMNLDGLSLRSIVQIRCFPLTGGVTVSPAGANRYSVVSKLKEADTHKSAKTTPGKTRRGLRTQR